MDNSRVLELLRKRRSIRQFSDVPVAENLVGLLIEAAVRTPTSRGLNPWEFIVVQDLERIKKLAAAKAHGSAFLAGAPLAIVVAADTTKSDVWTEDCSIAAFSVQLAAEDLGLGSCWVQIRKRPHDDNLSADTYLKGVLDLPEHFSVECIIGVGHPAETKQGHTLESLPFHQVHKDRFKA